MKVMSKLSYYDLLTIALWTFVNITPFTISIYTVPNVLAFRTPYISGFLVFGVRNAKYLTFGTRGGVCSEPANPPKPA